MIMENYAKQASSLETKTSIVKFFLYLVTDPHKEDCGSPAAPAAWCCE